MADVTLLQPLRARAAVCADRDVSLRVEQLVQDELDRQQRTSPTPSQPLPPNVRAAIVEVVSRTLLALDTWSDADGRALR
jgi:hypothetical protein